MSVIKTVNLRKEFTFSVRNPNKGWLGNFFTLDTKNDTAVDSIVLSIDACETVAFIGPNGAGKSTTIKMLTGILHPTAGTIDVLGFNPQKDRKSLALQIGTVFGQRSQLVFNLPLTDSFDLLAAVYSVPRDVYRLQTAKLIEAFGLEEFLDQPVRKLSLGQRMRAEVAASLIHNPRVVFLDVPTIGLDVVAKRALRETLKSINKELGTTIFLTSHDAGDIESVCERTIVVNHGAVVFDGTTRDLSKKYLKKKVIRLIHDGDVVPESNIPSNARVSNNAEGELEIEVDTEALDISRVLSVLMAGINVVDIAIEDPPLEEVIRELYQHAR